jgi:hypothetical protein
MRSTEGAAPTAASSWCVAAPGHNIRDDTLQHTSRNQLRTATTAVVTDAERTPR